MHATIERAKREKEAAVKLQRFLRRGSTHAKGLRLGAVEIN